VDALVRASVALAKKNVPVIAGCGSNSTAKTVAQIEEAKRLGADACARRAALLQQTESGGTPRAPRCVRAHRTPDRAVPRARADRAAPAGRAPRRALQSARRRRCEGGDGRRHVRLRLLGLSSTPFLSGDDFTFAPLVCMGAAGVISVLSNVRPGLTVRWCAAAKNGDVGELRRLNTKLFPSCRRSSPRRTRSVSRR
jgi:4-hydroxy-tetrahydrodipicolinate synthase